MKKYYDLTIPQKSIWYTEQFYQNTSIANISGTIFIKEKIDFKLLEEAINIVVKNNDSLRLRVTIQNNNPRQYFEEYERIKINYFKVKDKNECDKILNTIVSKHIDLLNEKTVKFTIFEFPDRTGGFSIVGNHIMCDAWSSALICSEVIKIYSKLKINTPIEEELISTYTDYIEAESEYINSDKYIKDMEYWKERFQYFPEKIAYIIPNTKEIKLKSLANRKEIKLTKKLTTQINEYCKENKISPYVFFMGVYSIYLSKLNGLQEIVIGTPMLNRKGAKEKQIIGMFVNTLPFKTIIKHEQNINELFNEISQDSMSMLRHQKYSYFELIRYIRENLKENSELYDVALSYQNAKTSANESEIEYTSQWDFNGHISETMNIHISDIDGQNNYNIYYDYQVNKLNETDINNLHQRIIKIINQIMLNNNTLLIKEIEIITEDDKNKLIQFNSTGETLLEDENVVELFEKTAHQHPNNIALKFSNVEVTYSELSKRINILATELLKRGVHRNTPIAIILDRSIDMIVAMFAIMKSGGCYVPILPEEHQDRKQYILDDCNPLCVIVHNGYEKFIKNRKIINLTEFDYSIDEKTIKVINKSNDLAYIIYTSGTTGNPKGVGVMHCNIASLKKSLENDELLKPTQNDISMSLLKYSFDASGIDIYSSLLFGGTLILIEKEDELNPNLVVLKMEKEKVTRTFLIPKWLEHIAIQDEIINADLSKLKILGTGGETLKPELIKHLYNKYKNLNIINLYGPTETTMFTTYKKVDKNNINSNYITLGKPIVYTRAIVLSKTNAILPIGIQGELCIYEDSKSVKNISNGYLNKSEETESKFLQIHNPIIDENTKIYKTGDIVKINSNLELEFFGRQDDIVKINGGYLVALNEVEKRIVDVLDGNYDVRLLAVPYNHSKTLVAFIIENKEHIKFDNITEHINNNITFYMRPRKIIELQDFPRNNSGKIDTSKLKEMAMQTLNKTTTIVLPTTSTEKIIYNIIKKHTTLDKFSITDDFMQELEIDSLAIASIYSELEILGIELQDIYTYTNIKDLGHLIDLGKKNVKDKKLKDLKVINNVKEFDITNVLLTGVTGFLGAHLLFELLKNEKIKKIYCIIRQKNLKTSESRFHEIVNYYFKNDKTIKTLISKKVVIIEGDITKEQFELNRIDYITLQNNVTTVINSAANVRHYGKKEGFFNTNVNSVKNILDFCGRNISLAHISTLSIGGFKTEKSENMVFTEDTLFIGQNLNNNLYLISKYKAEELILNSKVNCKIFRVGNIMPRIKDGKFQNNYKQNAFINAIKILLEIKKIPQEFINQKIEMSPVDECAKAITELINSTSKYKIYHIVSDKLITVQELIEDLKNSGYNVDIVDIKTFITELNKFTEIGKHYIKEYLIKNQVNNYDANKTIKQLNSKWKKIDRTYVTSILKIIGNDR